MRKIVLTLIVALGMAGGYAQNETGKFSIKPMAGVNISAFSGGMDGMYHTKAGFASHRAWHRVTPNPASQGMYFVAGFTLKAF